MKVPPHPRSILVVALFLAAVIGAPAQTFTTLVIFNNTNGATPETDVVQGRDGNLYGTTVAGGANSSVCNGHGCGTIFKMTPGGALTSVYSFCAESGCPDGAGPFAALFLALNGNFYGTTAGGGAYGDGTAFKTTATGKLTTLTSFAQYVGIPSGLIQASDGNFYGTTQYGGAHNAGTVFKITANGALTTLYSFCSKKTNNRCADGQAPLGGLVQATNGNFYGTTFWGGADDFGTVFKITTSGRLVTLHSLAPSEGKNPEAEMIQASDGNLYGTASSGGHRGGTIFKITPVGKLSTLYRFCSQSNCTDGNSPVAALVQATDGNFYGTTHFGGYGTIFQITPSGVLTTLYRFCSQSNCADGKYPDGGVFQATDGNFYGTTATGGSSDNGYGTIFRLSMGFAPFFAFVRASGKVGSTAEILGQGFTGTNAVSFNGTAATFVVHSDTYLTATVPSGATTGFVTVTTPKGTLKSNVPFRVRQ